MDVAIPTPGVSAAYGHAWRQLKRFFFPLLGLSIVGLIIESIGSGIQGLLAGNDPESMAATGAFISGLYSLVIGTPLTYGLMYIYLRAARGHSPTLGDLFAPFTRAWLPSILAAVLYSILVAIGFILLIIPGIIIGVRLGFVTFLVVDEGLGPVEAIKESWRRTSGHFWTIIGTALLAIPIVLVGILLLIVGVIPAIMWTSLAYATVYAAVTAHGTRTAA